MPYDRISDRRPLEGHLGESGATLERATLDGSIPVVLKHFDLDSDVGMKITADMTGRAADLWVSGALDRLPAVIDHAILDAWRERDGWTLMMRDVSAGLISVDRTVTVDELRRVVSAVAELHGVYWDSDLPGVTPLSCRLQLMSPKLMVNIEADGNRLPGWILEGWDAFHELVGGDVADAVRAIHDDVEPLATEMSRGGSTLLHGDLWLQNVALLEDQVVLIDWALASHGPPAVEWAYFLGINWWQTECSHEQVLDLIREAEGGRMDERSLQLGLLWGCASYGWNKAWHAVHNQDEATRRREREDLDWWVGTARAALGIWSPI